MNHKKATHGRKWVAFFMRKCYDKPSYGINVREYNIR